MAHVLCVGHAVQDFVFHVETMPATAAKHRSRAFESVGGGPAATAAVAIARLGGTATLATRLGDDPVADVIVRELERYGVDCTHARRFSGGSSSVSAVLVDARGERLIVNHLDPQLDTAPDWLPDVAELGADAVLADTRWPDGARRGMELARAAGVPGILDADVPVPADPALLAAATHVAFSADGLRSFSGEDSLEPALLAAARTTGAWCCATIGGDGTLVVTNDRVERIAAFDVDVRDTVGAGDVWHGAFALALAEGRTETDALRFAGAAAALKVQNGGTRSGAPDRAELQTFVNSRADIPIDAGKSRSN